MAIHKVLVVDDSKTELMFLTDLLQKNGFQLTRAIARDPAFASVPIILCTSKNQETDRVWGMRQGARDYIVKPVSATELMAKISALN